MAYLQHTSWKDRPGAVVGVIGIHALIGYALVTGLQFTGIEQTIKRWKAKDFVEDIPLPPPPPEKTVEPKQKVTEPVVVTPIPPVDVSPYKQVIDTTPVIPPSTDLVTKVIPQPTPAFTPAALPAFPAVGARPRGNVSKWVTVDDYRPVWISKELAGTARFRLEVGANGRVDNCTITTSSGHPELDKATCALVTQRARFDPAKDDTGAKVAGTYSNSVRWELPD